ncbi:MAG TPA: S8 family serine peptidase, partial [Aquihabitans sp.]|nr:S8 family serine peptidase [Aquihabitans sp.]
MTAARRGRRWVVATAVSLGVAAGSVVPATANGPGPRAVDDPAVTSGLAWHLDATGARTAWRSSLGVGTTVAVVDSPVDAGHPDLVGQVAEATSCVGAQGDPARCTPVALGEAPSGDAHGTHVAGIVAARADDGVGVAGVAPRARLLAIHALLPDCDEAGCVPLGDTADVAAGVRWAVANGADVINLSLTAGRRLGPDLTAALEEAWAAGAVPVLAAGNGDGTGLVEFLDRPSAVIVTATTRSGASASYAPDVDRSPLGVAAPGGTRGDTPATCAVGATPGGIISSSARGGGDGSGYACLAGTSMAAPQVSGGLALLLAMGFDRDG